MKKTFDKKSSILVIDDDPAIQMLYTSVLTKAGFDVKTANNGLEAMLTFDKTHPSLVIVDLVMPEQEGIETILQIQKKHPALPILAISGAIGGSGYLRVANLLGADMTLQKPIAAEQLVVTVEKLLAKARHQR